MTETDTDSTEESGGNRSRKELEYLIRAEYGLIYVVSSEEERVEKELAARVQREEEVEVGGRVERVREGDDERVVHRAQHVPFGEGVAQLVALDDVALRHHLRGAAAAREGCGCAQEVPRV